MSVHATVVMLGIPQELLDTARIDGASEYGVFFRVIVPLTKTAPATLASLGSAPAARNSRQSLRAERSSGERLIDGPTVGAVVDCSSRIRLTSG